jgi:hypothetical protein
MPVSANVLPIIIAVAVLIVGAIAAFYITRMMKGKIEIQLSKSGFNTGETIGGTVTLTTKKALDTKRVFVALIGYEVIERPSRNANSGTDTDRNEIYRDEFNLEEAGQLPAGFNKTYEIALVAPGTASVGSGGSGGVGIGLSIGPLSLGSSRSRRLEWKLEARADLPGVDIAKTKSLRINVS